MQPTPATQFHALRRNVGYFTGRGGTIGWLASPAAPVVVDTQFPDTAALFMQGLPGRKDRNFDAVINTHHHADHTGGNATFNPVSKVIAGHANVPELMLAAAKRSPNPAAPTIPTETFSDSWKRDFGDEKIAARYFRPAHTSGDIVVHFEKANVVHTGDLVFNRLYPVIDRSAGGRFKTWLTTLDDLIKTYPADASYIFGHGNQKFAVTGDHADIKAFRDYIEALLAHVEKGIKAGQWKEEIVKLDNLPGFPDLHVPPSPNNRFTGNLAVAYDELTTA